MLNKTSLYILTLSAGMFVFSGLSFGQEKTTTTTTTVEESVQTKIPTTTKKARKSPAKPSAKPAEATTSVKSTTTTTEVIQPPPPMKEVARKVYDEETLKKMSDTLCSPGFKAYVGDAKKNVCSSRATPPDIAFSCVWDKEGPPAFAPSAQGPCNLEHVEHRGKIIIQKTNFPSDPPLSYGREAECCFRAAKGLEIAGPH